MYVFLIPVCLFDEALLVSVSGWARCSELRSKGWNPKS